MSLVFASICPHPPILIPEVGGKEVEKIRNTQRAMEDLASKIAEKEPDTMILVTPHGLVYPDRMNVCGMPKIQGDLSSFGASQVSMKFTNDLDFAEKLNEKANNAGIQTLLYDNGQDSYVLDHGALVPLYYLTKELNHKAELVPVTYSFLDRGSHFKFGQIIHKIIKNSDKNFAFVASGDLSHRLIPHSPAGYSETGKKFDQKLVQLIKKTKVDEILNLDPDFVEEAGECGLRSILILLGVLSSLKWKAEILSYEGPFGVGYLVANFNL